MRIITSLGYKFCSLGGVWYYFVMKFLCMVMSIVLTENSGDIHHWVACLAVVSGLFIFSLIGCRSMIVRGLR